MKTSLNHILIVDVESTRWEGKLLSGKHRDIIEIGVVELHMENFKAYKWNKIFVSTDQEISRYCTELTGITRELLRSEGISYQIACSKLFQEYNSYNRIWISWGDYDRLQFIENSQRLKGVYPFSNSHINLKHLFSLMMGLTKGVSLDKALELSNLEFEGIRHSALDDALNTAKLFIWMVKKCQNGFLPNVNGGGERK